MTNLKRKKLWIEQKNGQIYTLINNIYWRLQILHENKLKQPEKSIIKNSEIYNTYHTPIS